MIAGTDLMHRVATIIAEVSATAIEPRMLDLADGEVHSKAPGELVTVADVEAERLLTERLSGIFPSTPVVGEEACEANPSLLDALSGERAWLVDPLDGTANFVAGSTDWAVMVALLQRGITACSWIWQPIQRRMYMAERGAGAVCDNRRLRLVATAAEASELTGRVHTRFLDDLGKVAITRNRKHFGEVLEGRGSAGTNTPRLRRGSRTSSCGGGHCRGTTLRGFFSQRRPEPRFADLTGRATKHHRRRPALLPRPTMRPGRSLA
jgi:fructose-1,6-bisphosphatase/inositol monophosphatase family enzyme